MISQHDPCTVLVIDPCPETQALIAGHVRGREFSIIAASHPSAALTAIDRAAPDIVITDLFLPEATGLALTKDLSSRQEACPVIVMAQDVREPAVVHALRAGAVDVVHKPVAEAELDHALARARQRLPGHLVELPGVCRSEVHVSMDSDPAHISRVISWLMKTTASTLPDIQRLHLRGCLQELLLNAVEHGNLEIFYQEKQKALADGGYEELLGQRRAHARLKHRRITIHVDYDNGTKNLVYRIADEGNGFKWRSLLNRSHNTCRADDANGRGIFLARYLFPSLTYNDQGNEAMITVPLV